MRQLNCFFLFRSSYHYQYAHVYACTKTQHNNKALNKYNKKIQEIFQRKKNQNDKISISTLSAMFKKNNVLSCYS